MAYDPTALQASLKKYQDLAKSLSSGYKYSTPALTGDSRFDTLSSNEIANREALGTLLYSQLNTYGDEYENAVATQRAALAKSLSDTGSQTFQSQNPYILQDLNARGLSSSASEVGRSQAEALKAIALENQKNLTDYDLKYFDSGQAIKEQALTALTGQETAGAEGAMELARLKLQADLEAAQSEADRQNALAVAKLEQKNALKGALISSGGNILGGALGGYLSKGTAAKSLGSLSGSGSSGSSGSSGVSGLGQALGTVGAIAVGRNLYNKGTLGTAGKDFNKIADPLGDSSNKNVFKAAANNIGGVLFPTENLVTNAEDWAKSKGGAVATVAKVLEPTGTANKIVKSIKKLCFLAGTKVKISDGKSVPIENLSLGDGTMGGSVYSVRKSITEDGTLFNYKGVFVTGSHAVKEDGKWIRVESSQNATPIPGDNIVYSIQTTSHRIFVDNIEFADEAEVDGCDTLDFDGCLEKLNAEELARTEVY